MCVALLLLLVIVPIAKQLRKQRKKRRLEWTRLLCEKERRKNSILRSRASSDYKGESAKRADTTVANSRQSQTSYV